MTRLAQTANPLLEAEPTGRPVEQRSHLRLTQVGQRALAGHADHIALNGIDRWIGGVHLTGHNVPWRWNEGTETITTQSS
jgi:hypothetical protein